MSKINVFINKYLNFKILSLAMVPILILVNLISDSYIFKIWAFMLFGFCSIMARLDNLEKKMNPTVIVKIDGKEKTFKGDGYDD